MVNKKINVDDWVTYICEVCGNNSHVFINSKNMDESLCYECFIEAKTIKDNYDE
jgi:hypothetical protein